MMVDIGDLFKYIRYAYKCKIKKKLPIMVAKRVSNLFCSKEVFVNLFVFYDLTWPDKCFKTTEKGTFKIEKMKDKHFDVAQKMCRMWLGRGNEVVRIPHRS